MTEKVNVTGLELGPENGTSHLCEASVRNLSILDHWILAPRK
jgi:hypothetical protein